MKELNSSVYLLNIAFIMTARKILLSVLHISHVILVTICYSLPSILKESIVTSTQYYLLIFTLIFNILSL